MPRAQLPTRRFDSGEMGTIVISVAPCTIRLMGVLVGAKYQQNVLKIIKRKYKIIKRKNIC